MSTVSIVSASQLVTTFSCFFFSALFGSILWRSASLQLYYYCEKFWKTDHNYLKAYVLSIWILDTVHQAILMEVNYVYFVSGIVNPILLTYLPKEIGIIGFIIAVIDAMVQLFFLRRVWCLSGRNRLLTGLLFVLVLSQLALTMTYSGIILNKALLRQAATLSVFEMIMNTSAVFVDMPLALSMIWFLWRNRSGVRRTDSIVNRIITLTIGSGLVTAFWAIIAAVSAAVVPRSLIYISSDLIFPKLYFNCMMTSLNARSSLREALNDEIVGMSFGTANISSSVTQSSNVIKDAPPRVQEAV
ncbi:hypothetical protein ACEPAG_2205 [Sanghuangporus baumii]